MQAINDTSALNPSQRLNDLDRIATEVFDVFVIGGGVTGVGAALDAASRGLNVALVEQRDYASGTSSRSSKLFHGGLRYLEQFEFGLVQEALRERNLMVNLLCPHLTRPVSFVYPLTHPVWERAYVGAGILLYDLMARRAESPFPGHQHLSKKSLAALAPALSPAATRGAIRYWDVLVDDARHTMTLARTAASQGAALATSTRVTGLDLSNGSLRGIEVTDLETGLVHHARTRSIINATGVWTDDVEELGHMEGLSVSASKGIHLVVPRDRIDSLTGMILRTESSVLFVIPFDDFWLIGTTDTPWTLRRAHPAASRQDIDYLIHWVNTVLTSPLRPDDVIGVYAGLRPLLSGESDQTSKLSREHAVVDSGTGLISVAGGKYTTYRVMAKDAVDAAILYLDHDVSPSRTSRLPLIGAEDYEALRAQRSQVVDAETYQRLLGRYGSKISDLLGFIEEDPDLAERVVADSPYLRAEMVYAATHEGAMHLDDFLARRTRISIQTEHRGTNAMEETALVVGATLGWSTSAREREIAHYRSRVEAERDSQRQPDDRTADAARMGAPDVRTGTVD